MRLERIVDQVRPFHVAGRVEAFDAGQLFRLANPFVGQRDVVLFFVDREMQLLWSIGSPRGRLPCSDRGQVGRAADDQRRSRFVDQDVVDFVDDRVVQRALALLGIVRETVIPLGRRTHVVAQVVKAEFVVRAVGDVAHVGGLFLGGRHARLDRVDGQTQGSCTAAPSTPCRDGPGSR